MQETGKRFRSSELLRSVFRVCGFGFVYEILQGGAKTLICACSVADDN